jgi:hypothetical protein
MLKKKRFDPSPPAENVAGNSLKDANKYTICTTAKIVSDENESYIACVVLYFLIRSRVHITYQFSP